MRVRDRRMKRGLRGGIKGAEYEGMSGGSNGDR